MGLGRERFFSLQRRPESLTPLSQNGEVFHEENTPFSDSQEQRRLGEVRIKLIKEPGEEELQEAHRLEDDDGFESFTDPCNEEGDRFINLYGGNFSQNMKLNREAVERF